MVSCYNKSIPRSVTQSIETLYCTALSQTILMFDEIFSTQEIYHGYKLAKNVQHKFLINWRILPVISKRKGSYFLIQKKF